MTYNQLTLLGVQGLSCANYTAAELKIMLCIIQQKQQYIKDSVIRYKLNHDSMVFSKEQRIAGHAVMVMKMSELGLGTSHISQLRSILDGMQRKPIWVPFKVGDLTSYAKFDSLFTCEMYQNRNSRVWMVKFTFDNGLLRHFFSFDKGACRIDMGVVYQLRSAHSIKLYLVMKSWATKGFTRIKPSYLMRQFYADESYYKSRSLLERNLLQPATKDLKRLYDNRLLDQYLTFKPVYMDEADQKHHKMPNYLTFTLHDRKSSGEDEADKSVQEELKGKRAELKLLLVCRYHVKDSVAEQLSHRLTLGMVGDLSDWWLRKEYFLDKCRVEKKSVNLAGYIVKGLDGFFRDRQA